MEFTNFVITHTVETDVFNKTIFAEVSVTTGCLWWKRTTKRLVAKNHSYWFFLDTGEFTPDFAIEKLERAFKAKKLL